MGIHRSAGTQGMAGEWQVGIVVEEPQVRTYIVFLSAWKWSIHSFQHPDDMFIISFLTDISEKVH